MYTRYRKRATSYLRKFDITLVIYNRLAEGLFVRKYLTLDKEAAPAKGRFSDKQSYGKMYRDRYFNEFVVDALDLVKQFAKEHTVPLIEVALRWCVYHSKLEMASEGGDDGTILRMSSYEQL